MSALTDMLAAAESYKAGPTGLFVIILLGIGIVFLGRSMVKHLRKVPASFDPPPEPGAEDPDPPPRQARD